VVYRFIISVTEHEGRWEMKYLRLILFLGCFCLLLPAMAVFGGTPALSQGVEIAPEVPQYADVFQVTVTPTVSIESLSSTFEITLAELGYGEKVLSSPYGSTEYTLRLPEGWELREGSFFELDFSYTYNRIGISETQALPPLFGDLIVVVDEETQLVFPIEEATLEHSRLRINLPLPLLNDPARSVHSIRVALDAGLICEIPHKASLIIHPTSLFSLAYDQLPVTPDLALYPRPFYQRAFEPDQVRFVLPARPTELELAGAVAVAAKLGDLTYRMVISGTTDLELLDRLEAGETLHEHLIVIGRPETNGMILRLNQLGVLPVSLQERQLDLTGEGPTAVAPGSILTYTLTLTNTGQDDLSSLSLVNTLPAGGQLVTCSPSCSEAVEGKEVSWSIASLGVGEALSYTLELRLSEVITDSVVENTATLLDAASNPLNVHTLTTTTSSTLRAESGPRSSVSAKDDYFFSQGGRAVPEHDGIVQEIVSPWDQTRAILIITGLSDEAVYKASRAMSSSNRFPGIEGSFALVREVRPLSELAVEPPSTSTDLTFADLGYRDKAVRGFSQETDYYFYIPLGWRLTEAAYLDLRFSHSQLLDYGASFLSVLFNKEPIATVALNDETSLNGKLKVALPPSQARPGQSNRISIQTEMHPFDVCVKVDMWLLLSGESVLHLAHNEQDSHFLDLALYPYPFDWRSDLADVLFVLPPEPRSEEWEEVLQLAAALGSAAGGPNLAPAVAVGDTWPETVLGDYHLIAIGQPSRNPALRQINAQLPQPFQPGSDEIEQRIDEVVFRLPPGLSLGLVQLIASPWNETRPFLAVTGTTDEGVKWATHVLVNRYWSLEGNLAFIQGDQINTVDTRELTSSGVAMAAATAVPEMTPVPTAAATTTPTPLPPSPTSDVSVSEGTSRPGWLIPLVGITGLIVIAIFAVAFWQARRRSAIKP
jgi:uncharacterized repeat protein (TIGR01451 family)